MPKRKNKPVITTKSSNEIYIEHQYSIADNIIIVNDLIAKDWCDEYKEYVMDVSETRWSPGIRYGNSGWPISEWGYTLMNESQWHESQVKEETIVFWEEIQKYLLDAYDVDSHLTAAHLNAMSFGQEGRIHRDDTDGTDIFAIIFFNDDMDVYDGGEFQTYINLEPNHSINKDYHLSEIANSISPKSGRVVFADARLLHRGLAPTRFYTKIRLTMALKIKFNNYEESMKKLGFVV